MMKLQLTQNQWHESAVIQGNRMAIAALRDALDQALRNTRPGDSNSGFIASVESVFDEDGEEYEVVVRIQE